MNQPISPLYTFLFDMLNTANCFKLNMQAYLSIKNYAFNCIQQSVSSKQGQLFVNEMVEYDKQFKQFQQEIQLVISQNQLTFLNKDQFEAFILQIFSTINFDTCDKNTLIISNNLLTVFSGYGALSEKYSKHKNFLMFKISQSNNIVNTNTNQQSNDLTKTTSNTLVQTKVKKPENIDMNKKDFDSLVDRNIKLPVKKGSEEYNNLKERIKDHMMYAEQEALYSNMQNAKAHTEVAIYYLKNIQE